MGGNIAPIYYPGIKKSAFLKALFSVVPHANSQLKQNVPANDDDPVNIAYYFGAFINPGDELATFVQTTFGLSNLQIASVFVLAATASNVSNYSYQNLAQAYPIASSGDAQNLSSDDVLMTPLKTKQAIDSYLAIQRNTI